MLLAFVVTAALGAPQMTPVPDRSPALLQLVKKYTCAGKTKCSQMESCEEAMYYLKVCGVTRLDGDGDGVPCEKLCG
jgi:hypothetical protein